MNKKLLAIFLTAILTLSPLLISASRIGYTQAKASQENYEHLNEEMSHDLISKWRDFIFDGNSNFVQLVVGLTDEAERVVSDFRSFSSQYGARILGEVNIKNRKIAITFEVEKEKVESFIAKLHEMGLVRYVEPRIKFKIMFVPNDPHWDMQWGPKKIDADWAWNYTFGNRSILVAVIDTGIDYTHPDLVNNYVPLGYDWVNGDPDPKDDHGHGTMCAGIIAAEINNSIGIAGLAQVRIMAEKGLDKDGSGYDDWLANAIIHATDQGADIISMSWGGYYYSKLIHDAIKYAYSKGVLLIAAAGNEHTSAKSYPAALDEVIAVSATNENDLLAIFSNYGDWVELAAPGVNIFTTSLGGDYISVDGTSFSAPHVAGVAALIWSYFPNKTRDWVRLRLRYTVDDLGVPGFDVKYGYGRVNAEKAVATPLPSHDLAIYHWVFPPYAEPNNPVEFKVEIINFGASDESNVTVYLLEDGAIVNSTTLDTILATESLTISLRWAPSEIGKHNFQIYIEEVSGEENVDNNIVEKSLYVGFPIKAVVLDSEGNIAGYTTVNWDKLNENWDKFGSVMIYIDYKSLDIEEITYEDIASTGADVLIISSAWSPYYGWEFTDSEIDAIKRYITEGHGIIVTEASFYHRVPNNNKLAPLLGLDQSVIWNYTFTSRLDIIDPNHPIMQGIPNPYSFSEITTGTPMYGVWDDEKLSGGSYIAMGQSSESCIVVYKRGRTYISPLLEGLVDQWGDYNLKLIYNALTWSPQELSVQLEVPNFVRLGNTVIINSTIKNDGLTNETDITFELLINGSVVYSEVIANLSSGAYYNVSYSWTPEEGKFNVTAYVHPVKGEAYIANNVDSKFVTVTWKRDIAVSLLSVPNAVYPDRIINVTVTVENLGELPETFNVNLYCNSTLVEEITVENLLPGENLTLYFAWNTTGLQPCNYIVLSAQIPPVPDEMNEENNILSSQPIKVKMLGDIDGNGKINIYDVIYVTSIYGSREGDPNWNPEADLASPWGVINIYDVVTVAMMYGEEC